mmetsp:Transcript_54777/g.108762  ORF Transcript_54777/g.108762 Transcript_54777/m.108762 type:complete len:240 (-) Transcript_54777:352-1071(-)
MSCATFFSTSFTCSCSISGSMSERSSGLLPTSPRNDDQRPLLAFLLGVAELATAASSSSSLSSSSTAAPTPKRSSRSTLPPLKTRTLRASFFEKSRSLALHLLPSSHTRASFLLRLVGCSSSSAASFFSPLPFLPFGPPPAFILAMLAAILLWLSSPPSVSPSSLPPPSPLPPPLPPLAVCVSDRLACDPLAGAAGLLMPQLCWLPSFVLANFFDSANDRGLLAVFSLRSSRARCSICL